MHSGALQPEGALDPRAHSFTNRLVNAQGGLNDLHQVWNTRVVAYNNTIQSGRSQIVRYQFKVPTDAAGPISITAKVNYRRFNQHFIDFGMGKHYEMPVVEIAARTRTLAVGSNLAAPPDPQDNKDWMRWNNYGIGLLDAQQYAESARAFQRVTEMRPDYADAYTNVAIADSQWERYDDARANLEKALQLAPHNARALYYFALVERIQGHLDAAISDLREVTAQFPRSRDAHRELGFSLYQQHKYSEARAEYETLQSIDPDDLAAHYILSIVYRRLGMNAEASREASAFADQKDDPTASTYALEFLRKHPEITSESVPWHTHSDLVAEPAAGGGAGNQ
jgi:Flp pilus assembly protein TadD